MKDVVWTSSVLSLNLTLERSFFEPIICLVFRAKILFFKVRTASMESVALFGLAATWRQIVAAAAATRRAKSTKKGARTTSSAPTNSLEEEEEVSACFYFATAISLHDIAVVSTT